MADRDAPPQKRYRLHIELGAHDLEHALSMLNTIVNDAAAEGLPAKRSSGGGYSLEWEDRDPTMTAERYEVELMEWFNAMSEKGA